MAKRVTYFGQWIRDAWNIFVNELNLIVHDNGVMLIFLFAGLVYPPLYNWVYGHGTVDEMPIAVVDKSNGSYSRRYIREVDATRECSVDFECTSLEEAKDLMAKRKVHGIIYIPSDFDSNIETGMQATVSTYADMSTFMYYKSLTVGTNFVMLNEIHEIQAERYAASGFTGESAAMLIEPVRYDEFLKYNPAISFTMFFVYMALMMIIQQVMFYGSATLAGTLREQGRSFVRLSDNLSGHGMGRIVLGRGLAYYIIFIFLGMYGAVLMPYLFHMPVHANWLDLLVFLLFFVADCVFFSFTWSTAIGKRETVLVLLLFVTPIAVFLTGFTWPAANIPTFWKYISYVFPTTFGCRGYMNLCNSGSLDAIAPEIKAMTIQTVVYFILAAVAAHVESHVGEEVGERIKEREFGS